MKNQHPAPDRDLHARLLRAAAGLGSRRSGSDLRPRPAALGLDPDRAGPRLAQIEGTQELPDIQRIVQELQGRDPDLDNPLYPAALADLTSEDAAMLGRR